MFFDVEATCIEGGGFDYPNEIIEFPVVLVDGRTFAIVSQPANCRNRRANVC